MMRRYRAGMIVTLFGLLMWFQSAGQRSDTVRVGQEADTTVAAAPDSSATADPGTQAADTSAMSSKDAAGDHVEPVVMRAIADSAVEDWKTDKAYAYANDPDYWRWREARQQYSTSRRTPSRQTGNAFEYFILVMLAGVLVY